MDLAGRLKFLACGTDIDVSLLIEGKISPRERAIVTFAFIPDPLSGM